MIKTEKIVSNMLKVIMPKTLTVNDFREMEPQVNELSQKHEHLRLLVDASQFKRWQNISAFTQHIRFVKGHHRKIERLALIAEHKWQHWIANIARLFVHPPIKVYKKNQDKEAIQWLKEK